MNRNGMTRHLVVALVALSLTCVAAPCKGATPDDKRAPDIELVDYRGKTWTLDEFAEQKILVIAFLGTECPLARLYSLTIQDLSRTYASRGVAFLAIDSNLQDSLEKMAAFARRQDFELPFAKDVGQQLMAKLGASRTPEVVVLDAQQQVRYRGRIDDQYGIGYAKKQPEHQYLRDALDALLAGTEPVIGQVEPVGCLIGRAKTPTADSAITYARQVARILNDHCVRCHRPDQIGPFSLTSYEDAAGWAEMIGEVVQQGRMPPWTAHPDYGDFINDCSLPAEKKQTLLDWIAAGAPLGDVAELPEPPRFVEGWQLPQQPDRVIHISPEPVRVKATGDVRYQYFVVDPQFDSDRWVAAAELRPGNMAVVHHILCFVRPRGSEGLGEGEGLDGFLAGYVPGMLPQALPSGYAKRIPAGSEFVFQVHYTPIGRVQTDHSLLGLIFADETQVTHEVITTSAVNPRIEIPAGADHHVETAWNRRPLGDWEILSYMPHMHLRGKSFRYEGVFPDGRREILLDVPRFDFNWQIAYVLRQPRQIPVGMRIYCQAAYDNSTNNLANPDPGVVVTWGDQTWEEMMIGYFDVAVPRGEGTGSAWGANLPRNNTNEQRLVQLFATWDKNGDNKLQRDEAPQRVREVFDRIDTDGTGEITLEQLQQFFRRR